MTRLPSRLIDAQGRWARPLGDWTAGWLKPLIDRSRSVKDFLLGTWLDHPLHAAITDVPVGSLTLMVILDLLGQDTAADVALGLGILAMLAAAVTGAADFVDTHGRSRMVMTVHAAAMVVALFLLVAAAILRVAGADSRGLGVVLAWAGYLVLLAGAYVGGEVVFALGHGVNRHAWRSPPSDWRRVDADDIPEGQPVKARAGAQAMVLVRDGATVHGLVDRCAHAGGPLSEGAIVDGCIECPWHGSAFELASGTRRRGPSLYDQPHLEVRRTGEGGYEVRADSTS